MSKPDTPAAAEEAAGKKPELTPDQKAAHEFLSELRSRITLQPLSYQDGVVARALESLWEVFGQAREAMKMNPGCAAFAALAAKILNEDIRPVTAKWHPAKVQGRLESRDGGDEFRAELAALQVTLRQRANELSQMAYGVDLADKLTAPALPPEAVERCLKPLPYGIATEHLTGDAALAAAMNEKEQTHVEARRDVRRKAGRAAPEKGKDAAGLALSGGGIRSASFSLGVVQVLAQRGLLEQFDFLSTVSGGGYTGSFITSRMGAGTPASELAAPGGPDTPTIRAMRQRAKFLTARSLMESWSMVIATLAGTLMNWTVPLLLLVLMALGVTQWSPGYSLWGPVTGGLAAASALLALVYFNTLRTGTGRARRSGWCFAIATMLCVFAALAWGLHTVYVHWFGWPRESITWFGSEWISSPLPQWDSWSGFWDSLTDIARGWKLALAGTGGIAAAVPVVTRFVPWLKNPKVRMAVIKVALLIASLILPVLGAAVLLLLCAVGNVTPAQGLSGFHILLIAAAVLAIIIIVVLDINITAPHRLYRNGLDKAFVQESEAPAKIKPLPLTTADAQGLAPYHLLNAAANLPAARKPGLRDRQCDFFLFSKHYTGSPVLGYKPTGEWKCGNHVPDLGTAMAISGAAASSNMGLGSIPALRGLLTLLNVRLGYWIRRPDAGGGSGKPGFRCLLREMTGAGLDEEHPWVNLSDGGHIENMAVYELLRRRCKFVVCVDGECDGDFTFGGFMTLVRHARIDFGVRISPDVTPLRPATPGGNSQTHGLLTRIHYPATSSQPDGFGLLLYLKLSMTGNESALINRYRGTHPDFPHQSTLDQFFDEEQFEAYRQLGVHAAESMFARTLMHTGAAGEIEQPAAAASRVFTMDDWFRRLASNLLSPLPDDPPPQAAA